MLKYYPLTRIITNKYTLGGEFVLSNGTNYRGRYYTTYTGESFTGSNPIIGTNEPLFRTADIKGELQVKRNSSNRGAFIGYQTAIGTEIIGGGEYKLLGELKPYYPFPIEEDYSRGYFMRYFAKYVSGPGYIFEISKQDWTQIQNGEIEDNILGYETANILWQLTGPLNNKRISQYEIQGGVYDTNKRVTEAEEKNFRGLVAFIGGDYTKFARITP